MKILYDHEVFTMQKYGGVSRYFYEIISRICRFEDANVNLFLGINDSGYNFKSLSNYFTYFQSIKIPSLYKFYILLSWINNIKLKQLYNTRDFNLLHKTYYSPVGLDFKGKKIVTVHDMTYEVYPSFFSEGDLTSSIKRNCVENADGIICVSKSTQNDLIDIFNVNKEKTCVIYHGNSLRLKIVGKRIIKEPYILFVGQRGGYKNFNLLLTAYANYEKFNKNFKLVCFGGGAFNKSELLYIREKNLEDNVLYTSGSDKKLGNLYKYASVLVYPSFYEGFGFPPIEAMYYGCPIIASEYSSIPEVVGNAGLFFNPYYIEDLIFKLELILSDAELREKIINNGFIQERNFDWNKAALSTFSFYKKIVGN